MSRLKNWCGSVTLYKSTDAVDPHSKIIAVEVQARSRKRAIDAIHSAIDRAYAKWQGMAINCVTPLSPKGSPLDTTMYDWAQKAQELIIDGQAIELDATDSALSVPIPNDVRESKIPGPVPGTPITSATNTAQTSAPWDNPFEHIDRAKQFELYTTYVGNYPATQQEDKANVT